MRLISRLVLIFALGTGSVHQGAAQSSYPDRPIRLVVAFVAGGATDTLARQIADPLSETLGRPVIVENRPGANGYLAWTHVAASDPDGYTLLLAENAIAMSQALYKKTGSTFDPITQFDAVAGVAVSSSALIVANNVPVNSVHELVAYSRAVPQKMNFASAGVGSVSHLIFEVFKDSVGIEAVHIPYKGGGQSITDVLAGHVPMAMNSVQVSKSLIQTGQLKGLGVTGPTRASTLPQVPTLIEAGMPTPEVELRFWYGIFGPKGMPPATRQKIEAAVSHVKADAQVRRRFAELDITPETLTAEELAAKLRREITSWTKFIDAKGIKPQ